jgi:hypothetical protein
VETIEIDGWVLEVDVEATRRGYAEPTTREPCRCSSCRNFFAVQEAAFPAVLRDLYTRLALPDGREGEIYELGSARADVQPYAWWLHVVGRIVHDPGTVASFACGVVVYFTDAQTFAPSAFDGMPLVQAELSVPLPWVLPEPKPSVAATG